MVYPAVVEHLLLHREVQVPWKHIYTLNMRQHFISNMEPLIYSCLFFHPSVRLFVLPLSTHPPIHPFIHSFISGSVRFFTLLIVFLVSSFWPGFFPPVSTQGEYQRLQEHFDSVKDRYVRALSLQIQMDEEELQQKTKDQEKFLQIALENYVKALQAGVSACSFIYCLSFILLFIHSRR